MGGWSPFNSVCIPYTRHPSPYLAPWQSLRGLGWEKAGAYFLAMDLNSGGPERERRAIGTCSSGN